MTDLAGSQFRWRFTDDSIGEQWSDWHTVELPCPACCHNGPEDGEHLQGAGYYDEDGYVDWSAHSRLDPTDIEEWVTMEWRQ